MKKVLLSFLVLGAAAVMSSSVQAAETSKVDFTYVTGDTVPWGLNAFESYDVAIYVPGATMQGKKLNSISVPMRASVATGISVWLSSDLKLQNKNGVRVAAPDILQVDVENEPMITLDLATPYEIPAEGVYVGYSFNIKSGSIPTADVNNPGRYPVTVSEGALDGGMYIHSSKTYRSAWKSNLEADLNYNADITVEIEGEFYKYAVGVVNLSAAKGGIDDDHVLKGEISQYGTEPLTSFEYTLVTEGTPITATYTFENPVAASFVATYPIEIELPSYATPGEYDIDLTINKVNGYTNEAPNNSGSTFINILSFLPVRRAVMEEYTGLWCGWCPRGYIGLLEMNKRHPEDFVALSYHNGDDMAVISPYPSNVSGFPSAFLDRVISCDAYYGSLQVDMGIDQTWQERCQVPTPCNIDVAATWNADSTIVNVKVTTRFNERIDNANYKIAYFLVGNGLTNSTWSQSNYYSGYNMPSEYGWDVFTQGGSGIKGLVFDDVVLWSNDPKGVEGTIPSSIVADEFNEYSGEIVLADVKNNQKLVQSQDISLFTVVALVVNGNNEIMNGNKTSIVSADPSAIESVSSDSAVEVKSVIYYDLNGRVAAKPAPGIFIKAETLSDGTTRTSKVVIY